MHYDYLIVGAGLYGCVFAHEMRNRGLSVLVIDKRAHVGGNVYTRDVRGIQVHEYGAHIFHTSDKEVWDYVRQFAVFNHYVNSPIAFYKDEVYNLPFNMNTFAKLWGVRTPKEARAKIKEQSEQAVRAMIAARKNKAPEGVTKEELETFQPRDLEEQGLMLAGYDVFEKLVRGYTEKQWGRSCQELPSFIIRRLPFRFIYDNNYFNDPYQGIPEDGYTAMCERMLGMDSEDETATNGNRALKKIKVRKNTAFEKLVVMGEDGLPKDVVSPEAKAEFANSAYTPVRYMTIEGDTVSNIVYTGRIDAFFDFKYGALEYRSLRFETEDLPDVDNYQGNAVVNYTEREIPYTRVIEHKHFNFGKGEGTVITREYPDDYIEGKEPYYPINDQKNDLLFAQYRALAAEHPNIRFGGRLGNYQYYNMDQVVRAALDDARAV